MQTIQFSGRTPIPQSLTLGIETDSNAETLKFSLPQIAEVQIATLQMILPDGTADVMQINNGLTIIPARIMEVAGTARAWVEILGSNTTAWHSELIYMGIGETPEISDRTEQQYPTALQEAISRCETAQDIAEAAAAYAAASSGQASFALNDAGHLTVTYTDTEGDSHSVDIGEVSAYAVAVKNGYTGTEAQWETYIANASINAAAAAEDALIAEGYAVGKQNGTDVGSASTYYQNNAKYYNTQAQSAKTTAQEAAATAAAAYDTDLLALNYGDLAFPVKKGQHCIHSGGYYTCIADIASSEEWTAAHWKEETVGGEVAGLKSAISVVETALSKLKNGTTSETETKTITPISNTAINYSTGEAVSGLASTFASTDFIPISFAESISDLFYGYGIYGYAIYDIYKTYISGEQYNLSIANIPSNAAYIRFTDYVAAGTHPAKAVTIKYNYTLTDGVIDLILQEIVVPQVLSNNLFNLDAIVGNGYYAASNGQWITRSDIASSGLIPVSAGDKYILCIQGSTLSATQVTYWDKNENFVSGADVSDPTKWTVPNNNSIKYMRVSLYADYLNKYYLNKGETALGYDEYLFGYSFPNVVEAPNIATLEKKTSAIGNKCAHVSFDDCTFWDDITQNAITYTSAFDNSFLNDLKTLHNMYGLKFTLFCFIVHNMASIENVTNKFAEEFSANKDWLRFGFHGTTPLETFDSSDPATVAGYYEKFVTGIYKMTGDYDCIDRVTRLSSFGGSKAVCKALRDADCGISGLLCNDNNAGSYFLTSDQWGYLNKRCKLFDEETQLTFIRSIKRLESNAITVSSLASIEFQNILPIYELFTHETEWTSSIMEKLGNFASWLKNHGFVFAYPQYVLNI